MTPAELKTIREACGLSQAWLAQRAQVNERTVRYWESGKSTVPDDVATLVLDAAYEATLLAALIHSGERMSDGSGASPKVWLTFIGGGVFGNRMEWIAGAIGRALARVEGFELDVRVAHYRKVNDQLVGDVSRAREAAAGEGPATISR